jgi:very-short-patch-repair endonuclease
MHDIISEINYIIKNNPVDSYGRIITKKSNKHILDFLVDETSFLTGDIKSTERLYLYINKMNSRPICETCRSNTVKFISYIQGYKSFCSRPCINKNKDIRDKIANTNIKKYGNACSLHGETTRKKVIKTFLKKYGVDHPLKNKDIIEKANKKTYINTYNNLSKFKDIVIPLFSEEEFHGTGYDTNYKWLCKKCKQEFNHYFHSHIPSCPSCLYESNFEYEVEEYIRKLNVEYDKNTRKVINPYELDFYIPNLKLAIECNGNYWHSEQFGKDKHYHLNKTNMCEENGIRLIHIFEDEWFNRTNIVKSKINNILCLSSNRIYARKCEIREIVTKEKDTFLENNHLQGKDKSSVKLGLFYNGELVSVMTFCKLRKALGSTHKEGSWELSRFCNKLNTTVVGGAGKLLKYFENNYDWNYIKSFADRRWSNGNLYNQLGFKFNHFSQPNYWYFKESITRHHRFRYRKSELPKLLDCFDPSLTEWQNMKNNNFDRIWDCGNYVFIKEIE